jgi:hypothetical protein
VKNLWILVFAILALVACDKGDNKDDPGLPTLPTARLSAAAAWAVTPPAAVGGSCRIVFTDISTGGIHTTRWSIPWVINPLVGNIVGYPDGQKVTIDVRPGWVTALYTSSITAENSEVTSKASCLFDINCDPGGVPTSGICE